MAAQQLCTIDPIMQSMYSNGFTVADMIQIENHIAAGDCPKVHPLLKNLATTAGYAYSPTPLVMAFQQGYLTVVQRMIEVWGVDIESRSSIRITGFIASCMGFDLTLSTELKDVTPLFVAALNNQTECVRYLVGKGADVTAKTSTENRGTFGGLTPLHGALLHGKLVRTRSEQMEVIRILLESGADPSALSSDGTPTWMFGCLSHYNFRKILHFLHKGFCNVQAINLLIEYGMSIDQLCPRLGLTLLHHMAGPANEFDDEEIIKILLVKGQDPNVRDKHGLTPIMTAAIGTNLYPNMSILKFLMERDDIPSMDKIEAVEVALAVLLSYNTNLVHTQDIDYCLSRAQSLRNIEGIVLTPKAPTNGRAVEWATSSDIEHILQRPLELEMQSILIRLRIFPNINWMMFRRYLTPYVYLQYCHQLTQQNQYGQLLDISWTMLETILRFAPTVGKEQVYRETFDAVNLLVDTLAGLKRIEDPLFNVDTLKKSFELLSSMFQNFPNISCALKTLLTMVTTLADLPDGMIHPIADYLLEIVDQNNKVFTHHPKLVCIACMEQTERTCDIIRFLLTFGAVTDDVNLFTGNGLLHILAKSNGEFTDSIARVLLGAGAHLDRTNEEGLTAAEVWMDKREQENKRRRREDQQPHGWRDLPDWLREDVPKLQCLSARIICSRRIPYKEVVPVTLHSFVALH